MPVTDTYDALKTWRSLWIALGGGRNSAPHLHVYDERYLLMIDFLFFFFFLFSTEGELDVEENANENSLHCY